MKLPSMLALKKSRALPGPDPKNSSDQGTLTQPQDSRPYLMDLLRLVPLGSVSFDVRVWVPDYTVENPDGAKELSEEEIYEVQQGRDLVTGMLHVDHIEATQNWDSDEGPEPPSLLIICEDLGPYIWRTYVRPKHYERPKDVVPTVSEALEGQEIPEGVSPSPQPVPGLSEAFNSVLGQKLEELSKDPQPQDATQDDLPFDDQPDSKDWPDLLDDDDLPF